MNTRKIRYGELYMYGVSYSNKFQPTAINIFTLIENVDQLQITQ
jgi:hypothetical protein